MNKTQNMKSIETPLQIEAPNIPSLNGKNIQIYNPVYRPTTARIYGHNLEKESGFNAIYSNKWAKPGTDPSKLLYQKYYNKYFY